jgi:hypothetical protein
MVKYKNFGTSGSQHQSIGSFSFSSQNSEQHSTATSLTGKSKSNRRNERSPSITRHEEDDCRDEDGSRFDPRILLNNSTEEEEIKERESESLYDMISYNGVTDVHSTSVCASFSYSAGDTDSSAGFSDPQNPSPNSRRAKLSYMGYVPVSPNTAAALEIMERREHSNTHRTRNSNGDTISDTIVNNNINNNINNDNSNNNNININNNNSGHTTGETTTATGSTFPSIKVDDTSTSRRRPREFDDDSKPEQQDQQQPSSANKNITEYITVGQQKCLEEQKSKQNQDAGNQKQQQEQSSNKDSGTVTSSSVADHTFTSRVEDATIATSVASSVMPNSCTGHPAMTTTNQRHLYQQQQQQQQQPHGQYRKNTKQDLHPLSPVVASPNPQQQQQTPARAGASDSVGGQEAWNENASLGLSPLTAGVSVYGMVPPSLNHPPAMMQSHWNPNRGQYQQHHGYQQSQPVQNYANPHLPHMHPYGASGNTSHQPQQQTQAFQSGFFPRNPVLARQLQAFHQYHNQDQKQEQKREPPSPTSPMPVSPGPEVPQGSHPTEAHRAHHSFEPVGPKNNSGVPSSQQSNGDNSSSDHQPFLICGPEGPRLMDNVKFVTPAPKRINGGSRSLSSHYSGALGVGCVQHPAGQKCQVMFAGFLNTCGAIVSHGYHTDNSKSSSKEKRAKFGKVADESIARLAQASEHGRGEERRKEDSNYYDLSEIGSGLNDAFAANAKMIIHAGNNIFDTFQKYAPVASPMRSDESAGFGLRVALSDDPDEVEAAKEQTTPVSPVSAQREHFKKIRRRRNRGSESPIRRSISEPNPALSPNSTASKEKGLEKSFKDRYSRNLHTKLHYEKLEKGGVDDKRESDPAGSKDEDESHYSWATPNSREESNDDNCVSVNKQDPPSVEPRSRGDKPRSAETEDVVVSSTMSDSLVGSDVDEEEDPQLDILNSALSEDERQEELTDGEEEEHLLLDSYDHNEFPYTPLDVIEEGSEDEDTTTNAASIKNSSSKDLSIGIDAPMDGQVLYTTLSDDLSIEGYSDDTHVRGRTSNVIGFIRIVFFSMLFFHCGTIVCLWDQFADQIRTIEGGPAALSAAEDVVANLKASGVSLVTTAKDIINVDTIDISVGEILSGIESRTTAMMGAANQFLAEFAAGNALKKQEAEDDKMQLLFHQLVDDALWSDDDFVRLEEDIISVVE